MSIIKRKAEVEVAMDDKGGCGFGCAKECCFYDNNSWACLHPEFGAHPRKEIWHLCVLKYFPEFKKYLLPDQIEG